MNCAEVQQVLPEIIDGSEDSVYQAHLKSCPGCSELVFELKLIARESRQLAEIDDPPQRLWVKIAAELRAEGIIREPNVATIRPQAVVSPRGRWNSWWLVPVAVALLAAGSYVIKPKPTPAVANQTAAPARSATAKAPESVVANNEKPRVTPAPAGSTTLSGSTSQAPMTTVGTADQRLLDGVPPERRSAYESQLKAVNSYIHDAQAFIAKHPDDGDAQQHLMEAYEQREMLYQMTLDHVQ
jgi:hypothetical protein